MTRKDVVATTLLVTPHTSIIRAVTPRTNAADTPLSPRHVADICYVGRALYVITSVLRVHSEHTRSMTFDASPRYYRATTAQEH